MDLQDVYNEALFFAAGKHQDQKLPGTDLPYLTHVVNVAMEVMVAGFKTEGFDTPFAISIALLHDTMEDTETSYNEIKGKFGARVADGILALSKFENLKKSEQMQDSLDRIKQLDKEVWSVKLADRISNLEAPSIDWDKSKRKRYQQGAENILKELGDGNAFLAQRLKRKITEYEDFVATGKK